MDSFCKTPNGTQTHEEICCNDYTDRILKILKPSDIQDRKRYLVVKYIKEIFEEEGLVVFLFGSVALGT